MKIACDYYTIKTNKRRDSSNPITRAFINLEKAIEASVHTLSRCNGDDADAVFVFGSITRRKNDTDRAKRILKHRREGKLILAIDSSLFSTYIRENLKSSETHMFRIGRHDITGEGDFANKGLGPSRYEWFKKRFGFEERDPRPDYNKPILFLLQSEKGWQYDELDPYWQWARARLGDIRNVTSRGIILRGHPNLDRFPTEEIASGFDNIHIEQADKARRTVLRSLQGVGSVITHSSSAACEAIVEGLPTIALNNRCVVYDACLHDIDSLNHLEDFDWEGREERLHEWAWMSWTLEEMTNPGLIEHYAN